VGGGIVGVREGWGGQQKREEEEAQNINAAFYDSSPKPGMIGPTSEHFSCDAATDNRLDVAHLLLDARPGRLYPLVAEVGRWCCIFIRTETDLYDTV